MSWITLASADVKSRFGLAEWDAIGARLHSGQTIAAVVDDALAHVTQLVRGKIGRVITLGADGTIPPELEDAAIAIAVQRLIARTAGGEEQLYTKARQDEYRDAVKLLDEAAAGDFALALDAAPSATQPQARGAEMAGPLANLDVDATRRATRVNLSGL